MRTKVVTAPTAEPLDLEEAKDHLRIDVGETNQDDYIIGLIRAAGGKAEEITNRKLAEQTVTLYLDQWPGWRSNSVGGECIELPYTPFSTETAPVIIYKDVDSSSITVDSTVYTCDSVSEPGRICPNYNESWPTGILHNVNPISVQYICGYPTSTAVPQEIKQAMLIMISDLYENRESYVIGQPVNAIPNIVLNLLADYRVRSF